MKTGLPFRGMAAVFAIGLLAQACGAAQETDPPGAEAAQTEDPACASEEERKNAPPPSENDKVGVYFSCIATIGTQNQPLYMFERSVPPDQQTEEGRIFVTVTEYLEGPDEEEAADGYLTAIGKRVENVLKSVQIDGDHVTLDFSSAIEPDIPGTSTAGQVLVLEVKALANQFPQFRSLDLLIEGDCDRFWKLMEKSCQTVNR